MATKSIDKKKTLEYAVAFYFYDSGCVNFMMGNIMYQHIKTIYDERADGRGQNTLEVVYNYKKMKYEVLCLTDSKLALLNAINLVNICFIKYNIVILRL